MLPHEVRFLLVWKGGLDQLIGENGVEFFSVTSPLLNLVGFKQNDEAYFSCTIWQTKTVDIVMLSILMLTVAVIIISISWWVGRPKPPLLRIMCAYSFRVQPYEWLGLHLAQEFVMCDIISFFSLVINQQLWIKLCWTVYHSKVIVLMDTSVQHLIRWGSYYWKKWWCTLEDEQFWGMVILLSCLFWSFICSSIFSVISTAEARLLLHNFLEYGPLVAKKTLWQ